MQRGIIIIIIIIIIENFMTKRNLTKDSVTDKIALFAECSLETLCIMYIKIL
jgi:hypothetical protein